MMDQPGCSQTRQLSDINVSYTDLFPKVDHTFLAELCKFSHVCRIFTLHNEISQCHYAVVI